MIIIIIIFFFMLAMEFAIGIGIIAKRVQ